MSDTITAVTDADFDSQVLQADVPVLVDFWAPWCQPCVAVAPVLEELAADFHGQVRFAKIDIDQNPETPGRYMIRSIPTMMIFKDGQVANSRVGAADKREIQAFVEGVL